MPAQRRGGGGRLLPLPPLVHTPGLGLQHSRHPRHSRHSAIKEPTLLTPPRGCGNSFEMTHRRFNLYGEERIMSLFFNQRRETRPCLELVRVGPDATLEFMTRGSILTNIFRFF